MKIVKIPFVNSMGKTNGCEKAPEKIIENLAEIYSNESGKIINKDLLDTGEIEISWGDLEESTKNIYEKSLDFLKNNKMLFLGGDHSISFSTGKAFLDYCGNENKKPMLIVFDAHADCIKPGKEPTHEEWLRGLVEQGFPAENILLVGTRNIWPEEISFLSKNKIRKINMDKLTVDLEDATDTIMEFASGNDKELYVSLDIDVVDPIYAPATGYKEVGGLTSRQLIYIISRINKIKNLKAFDIVEINPEKDIDGLTVKLGVKVLSELL